MTNLLTKSDGHPIEKHDEKWLPKDFVLEDVKDANIDAVRSSDNENIFFLAICLFCLALKSLQHGIEALFRPSNNTNLFEFLTIILSR